MSTAAGIIEQVRDHPAPDVARLRPSSGAIFNEEWWVAAASNGQIERAQVEWDGVEVASLFYWPVRRNGMRKIELPPFTRIIAPTFNLPRASSTTMLANKVRVLAELFDTIGPVDSYHSVIRSTAENALAFQLNGFTLEPKLTFVSPASTCADAVMASMNQKVRNLVKTAAKSCTVETHMDLERFVRVSKARKEQDHTKYDALVRLWDAIAQRDVGRIITVSDECGNDIAAAIIVWDQQRAYYLASARAENHVSNKAASLGFFEAVKLSKRIGRDFDADGFATLRSGESLMKWGIAPSANMTVRKSSFSYQFLKVFKDKFAASPPPL